MENKMIYLDLQKQKRTLEQNEFTISVDSDEAKAFFTSKGAHQELIIDLVNKTTYFEEYEMQEDGTRYSVYNPEKVNNVYVPDLEAIATKEAEVLAKEQEELVEAQRDEAMLIGSEYNGYQVSLTKDDGDGLAQVKNGFDLGLANTVIHFENGTKMPIAADEFQEFALWFVNERNKFFGGN